MTAKKSKQAPSNSRQSLPKRYLAIPDFLFSPDPDFDNKPAMDILSRAAIRTLFFLFSQYKGRNNGDFSIAPKLCSKYRINRTTARKGAAELAYYGLIVETRRGGLNSPSLFGIAWLGLDEEVSYKFDNTIKPSVTPLQCYRLQYRHLRTKHLCAEHEKNIGESKRKPVPPSIQARKKIPVPPSVQAENALVPPSEQRH